MLSAALRAAGLHLRSADPGAMKDFLVAVHARAAEAAAAGLMSSRAEVRCTQLHGASDGVGSACGKIHDRLPWRSRSCGLCLTETRIGTLRML